MADISQIKLPDGNTYTIKTDKTDKVKCENYSPAILDDWLPIVIRKTYDSTTKYGTLAVPDENYRPEIDLGTGNIRIRGVVFPHIYTTSSSAKDGKIGYWINGAVVYERVYTFDSPFTLQNNSWTNAIESYANAQFINCIALSSSGGTCFNCVSAQYDATAHRIKLLNTRGSNITIDAVILQYYIVT